ncbi:adenine nucleotide alpha hydrolase family protein [Ancylobacter terrae]|uniref:electron transfer flavoprotein subunit beta n=1 Tax=Ancylobacter sp. sgz301288 TaxID=3342077 RepID=UPI00385A7404
MNIVVLLSAGLHPVSARPASVPVELQAIRLAAGLGGTLSGLHAGPDVEAAAQALGHGLSHLVHVALPAAADPLQSLVDQVKSAAPDLVLAGRRGQGGEDSGLLPYNLAAALGRPIVADAMAIARNADGTLTIDQALAKGARRRVVVRLPAVVTVHPAAPAPLPFAFGTARRGIIERHEGVAASAPEVSPVEERPYRPRPKLIAKGPAGASAAERLKAATQAASGGGKLLVDPPPQEAAREILAHLRAIGVLRR